MSYLDELKQTQEAMQDVPVVKIPRGRGTSKPDPRVLGFLEYFEDTINNPDHCFGPSGELEDENGNVIRIFIPGNLPQHPKDANKVTGPLAQKLNKAMQEAQDDTGAYVFQDIRARYSSAFKNENGTLVRTGFFRLESSNPADHG